MSALPPLRTFHLAHEDDPPYGRGAGRVAFVGEWFMGFARLRGDLVLDVQDSVLAETVLQVFKLKVPRMGD